MSTERPVVTWIGFETLSLGPGLDLGLVCLDCGLGTWEQNRNGAVTSLPSCSLSQ